MSLQEAAFRSILRIRRVEEETARIYHTDKVKSPVHLSIGQEVVSVGICQALEPQDIVFGTYRGHALSLAKGGDINRMVAELYGKVTGVAGGKGGSMHLIDADCGMMGTSAVVATTIPQAVGYAYAMKQQQKNVVVACFFGDGATEEGAFHESANFAKLKDVPLLFVCENNGYAIHSPIRDRQAWSGLCELASTYQLETTFLDTQNVAEIRDTATGLVQRIRDGGGPQFLEVMTCRWKEHVGPGEDWDFGYRPQGEREKWMASDALVLLTEELGTQVTDRISEEVEAEVQAAFDFAEQSEFPTEADLYAHVFKEEA